MHMTRFTVFIAVPIIFLSACSRSGADWIIEPGVRVGPITSKSCHDDLVSLYGSTNVVTTIVGIGEGFDAAASIIFPGDPTKKIEVVWSSSETKCGTHTILIRSGNRSVWKTVDGITLGQSIIDIEQLNGGPFKIAGYGWDYGGGVQDFMGGKLSRNGVFIIMGPTASIPESERSSVLGDKLFNSTDPFMRKLNPVVEFMRVDLYEKR